MKDFKSDNRSRDRRSFSDRDSRRPSLHNAVCDECGKDCQVPFRPSGDKPIYCSDCFGKKGGGNVNRSRDRRSFSDRDSRRPSPGNIDSRSILKLEEKIEILNIKLNTIIDLLSLAEGGELKSVKKKTKKSKKLTNKKANKVIKVLTPVKKKDIKEKKLKKK
ncbi:hypothetical protein COT75_01520 [Candidatus Beckwithbacteria bacterium CG10_big_fil_rev_8_21_14_0_10_34_10]|uniref:CxxC-x17-CxxC domain-containing protein n=1 Tax=Candidatus Beckwithbacteria bacterium CG10_big_fil_rev_8_21_14_0_10_34_10 TaxID=1974495 RepID=A0A2H0W9W4_9BACT|nr:MAG: hypothetical protein COT75_01520 [Candidatus Beckwithbacteria bacterium CG10_big_fil_rev_8_21_14_0_10_34_10]